MMAGSWQVLQWGIQDRKPSEWLMFLTEEQGELAKAISEWQYRNGDAVNIVKEAIQVATLALKIAEMLNDEETMKHLKGKYNE